MTKCTLLVIAISISVLLHSPEIVHCQVSNDEFPSHVNETALLSFTQTMFTSLSDLTSTILDSVGNRASFCVKNRVVEWDRAFNFSSNLDFLKSCIKRTNAEDVIGRVCYAAELKDYFERFFSGSHYLKPNRNCNITSRVSGCEPGWACAVSVPEDVEMKDFINILGRTDDCQPCCEGFFCPKGLTCMIPCPLGAYCPTATLDTDTGICKPYSYQLPPGMPNHTCGGANIWADILTSRDLFCSSGSYCPTSTQKIPCSSGHYCRTGSTSEKSCYNSISCNEGSSTQHIQAYGAMLMAAIFTILLIIYNCSDQLITIRERRRAKYREAASRRAKERVKADERTMELSTLHQSSEDMDYNDARTSSASYMSSQENILKLRSQTCNNIDDNLSSYGHSSKKMLQKGKQIHTHTEIFNYAYSQIEKEKAMQEIRSHTFSEATAMGVNAETRRRPTIEISFQDLTVTLKGKGRHLLRCVTGKIMPGRITAVMGPSGAGKTTFLSALAGKAHGCKILGSILVNGNRKIIGFVPQDDIVHGNLTVEENIWFNANCRYASSGYSLFQMFDDLVLLAKGGLTVYHGPVREVEEYFSRHGINVPDRVNPPDYFIDVLEGMVKLNTSSGVTCEQLPVRWMLHKGYHVPLDMQANAAAMFPEGQLSSNELNNNEGATDDHSFVGEIWEYVKSNVKVRSDVIQHNFLRAKDLSNRKTPGLLVQYRYFLGRVAKQRLRESKLQLVDYFILSLAGACLGSIRRPNEETFGALDYTYSIIALSLLCKVAALRTFSLDKLQYWRERASGISSLAHFLAKDIVDHFNTVVKPAVYLSMFYFFSNERSSFAENYMVLLSLVYCVTGIAYVLAIYLDAGSSQLFAVLLPVVLTLIPTQAGNSKFLIFVSNFCYPKWALEAFVISNANRGWPITRCGALQKFGYNVHNWDLCIFILIMIGVCTRISAFFGMLVIHKR